ncbi:CDP-diacylglycerol--serine O-phosphatidyltransferase [Dysgonomonas sp. 520]|uniref:CDP-diacylglycerol--serine O-phosphatidyltransferase n=1 Tax=Dysgonomonas sp. 520 TaxID=2302931 RepID=UPI0013D29C2D|nr:CDP-diacylglycerol--serine O-phosphatidyltransferase [Dysgonomonas sp. 520]NDW10254.1 CDP-diacylglycerol--serine O-phosphatidyltransferase [Dysgonomonas sp. 520]
MKKHIPNLFTCLNLFSGCIACTMAFQGEYFWVVFFVILGSIFDFFDGFMARLLKAYSDIGKELDSLADLVSFGVAPSLIVFHYITSALGAESALHSLQNILPYFAFVLTIFSALRLAKFNIDTRQTTSFIGLPTPANALFWISLCYGLNEKFVASDTIVYIIIVLIVIFSLLMVSEIPMFSLKVKNLKLKGNELKYLLIIFCIAAIAIWQIMGIAATIIFYIALTLVSYKKVKE